MGLGWATVLAIAVLALLHLRGPSYRYSRAVRITDPSMIAIRTMVVRGDFLGATARFASFYRFDRPAGLKALQQFSLLVLRAGLLEYDPYERCYAASALAAAGDRDEIPILVRAFQSTESPSLKMAIADGLGQIGDGEALSALQQLYSSVEPSSRRILVINASETHDPGAIGLLSDALTAHDSTIRLSAARGLGRLGNRRAITVLRKSLLTTEDSLERAMLCYSLLRLGDSTSAGVVYSILRSSADEYAREVAAVALGYAQDPRAEAVLKAALTDRNLDVRIGAAVALTHYADSAGTKYIMSVIHSNDPVTRWEAGQLLDEVEFRNGREVLVASALSPDPTVSMPAIRAIGLSGDAKEVGFLGKLADGADDSLTRAAVASALGQIGTPNAIAPLMALVADLDRSVRYTAADALDRAAAHSLE